MGPPRPPAASGDVDDDDNMIGPPRPPVGPSSDSDPDWEEENRYPVPRSNEIVLKGHTKVICLILISQREKSFRLYLLK